MRRSPLCAIVIEKEVYDMSIASSQASSAAPERPRWYSRLLVREMWASLAIVSMWLAVLFDALFGPDLLFSNAGTSTTSIPSAVVVAFFAYLGTKVVARYGLDRSRDA
jgi:hypothetical protein